MTKSEMGYAEAMAEVERILERIASEQVTIDALSVEVERATRLLDLCRKRLYKAEADVERILGQDDPAESGER